jgi:hypothetical protein
MFSQLNSYDSSGIVRGQHVSLPFVGTYEQVNTYQGIYIYARTTAIDVLRIEYVNSLNNNVDSSNNFTFFETYTISNDERQLTFFPKLKYFRIKISCGSPTSNDSRQYNTYYYTSPVNTQIYGSQNVPINTDACGNIMLTGTITAGTSTTISGPLPTGSNSIGYVTISGALPTGTNSIGYVTVSGTISAGTSTTISGALPTGTNSIGTVGLNAGANTIGYVTISGALPTGTNSIGYVTVSGTLSAGTSTTISGALPTGTNSIGYVTISGALPTGSNSMGTVGINTGSNSIGTVGLNTGSNSIGTVGINTGSNSIGTVGLNAGTNTIG